MTLNWNQTRVQWTLAILLATIAGYVDGFGLLFLKTFVSYMSGNTTITGVKSGHGDFHAAFPSALAIVFFVVGSFSGNLLFHSRWRHSYRMTFSLIAGGLAVVSGLEWARLDNVPLEIAILCISMGMLNPALSKIGNEPVSLTFMTGTLSKIGSHLALAAGGKPLKEQQGPADSHLARAGIDASLWFAFLGGAILAGIAGSHFRTWALWPPCVIMLVLGIVSEFATPSPGKNSLG